MLIDTHPGDPIGLRLTAAVAEKWRIEGIPSKLWEPKSKSWYLPIRPNVDFLRENMVRGEFTIPALDRITELLGRTPDTGQFPGPYPGTPMVHQKNALDKAIQQPHYFFAHAMGTGKTYTVLTLANYLHREGKIGGLLVICPATIRYDVWQPQTHQWLGELGTKYELFIMSPGKKFERFLAQDVDGLPIMVAGLEAMSKASGRAYKAAQGFLDKYKCAMYVDESSQIKNPSASRTKNITNLGGDAEYRWCGTGTKITQGIHDLYAQFRFLHWNIIGQKSYYSFKNRYCKMGGFEGRKIIGYNNVQELLKLVGPYIDVVRKEDANDLPPKVYVTRRAEASQEQKDLYRSLKDYMEATDGGNVLTVDTMLSRMTRYQQIAGGNFPYQIEGEWTSRPLDRNPKLDVLMNIVEDTDEKVIVWARFTAEVEAIKKWLVDHYGEDSTVAYYGKTSKDERADAIEQFQNGEARFFVASKAASVGLTLTAATVEVYFSNSFSLEDRLQSEDRAHRTGQDHKVTIIDILIDLEIDDHIQKSILSKKSMATYVAGELRGQTKLDTLVEL